MSSTQTTIAYQYSILQVSANTCAHKYVHNVNIYIYICMYIYIYICVYVYIYIYVFVYIIYIPGHSGCAKCPPFGEKAIISAVSFKKRFLTQQLLFFKIAAKPVRKSAFWPSESAF